MKNNEAVRIPFGFDIMANETLHSVNCHIFRFDA